MTENCELCGEPMPEAESMFKFHGYSGPCPKLPLPKPKDAHEEFMQGLRFLLLSNGFWFDELNPDPKMALLEGFRKAFEKLKAKNERQELVDLLGRIVMFKARNIKCALWETGILEEVRFSHEAVGTDRVVIRMKDKMAHELNVREFVVQSRS